MQFHFSQNLLPQKMRKTEGSNLKEQEDGLDGTGKTTSKGLDETFPKSESASAGPLQRNTVEQQWNSEVTLKPSQPINECGDDDEFTEADLMEIEEVTRQANENYNENRYSF